MFLTKTCIITVYKQDPNCVAKKFGQKLSEGDSLIVIDNTERPNKSQKTFYKNKKGLSVVIIQNNENLGLGAALNQGLALKQYHRDVIFLFDQDSAPSKTFFASMVRLISQTEVIFHKVILGPKHIEKDIHLETLDPNRFSIVNVLPTSGMCFFKKNIKAYVKFSKKLFLDYCDYKFCRVLKRNNWTALRALNIHLPHKLGIKTISLFNLKISIPASFRHYFMMRDCLFIIKDKDFPISIKMNLLLKNVLRILIPLSWDHRIRCGYAFKGVKDFYLGIQGAGILRNK